MKLLWVITAAIPTQSSYYHNTAVYPPGQVLTVENSLRLYSYGSNSGGGKTRQLLDIISDRFGPVSSLTGTYQADVWRLGINRRDPDRGEYLQLKKMTGSFFVCLFVCFFVQKIVSQHLQYRQVSLAVWEKGLYLILYRGLSQYYSQ